MSIYDCGVLQWPLMHGSCARTKGLEYMKGENHRTPAANPSLTTKAKKLGTDFIAKVERFERGEVMIDEHGRPQTDYKCNILCAHWL
jgi:hypothetical protein